MSEEIKYFKDSSQEKYALIVKETGEWVNSKVPRFSDIKDGMRFVKFVPENFIELNLSKNEIELALVIMARFIRKNCFDFNLCFNSYGAKGGKLGRNAFYKSKKGLIEKHFMFQGLSTNQYFINSNIAFNGIRKKFLDDRSILVTPEILEQVKHRK